MTDLVDFLFLFEHKHYFKVGEALELFCHTNKIIIIFGRFILAATARPQEMTKASDKLLRHQEGAEAGAWAEAREGDPQGSLPGE